MTSPDHVTVGLSFEGQPPETKHTERRIRLDPNTASVQLGRTSKRDPNLASAVGNGWIDSPVISREHAELSMGDAAQPVYIKDLNSRHGTFLNHKRLEAHRSYPLMPGDILKLGTDIQRMENLFPPPTARVFIDAVFSGSQKPTMSQKGVFVVPDDTDSSDMSDDDVGTVSEIRYAVKALREVAGARHPRLTSETSQPLSQLAQQKPPEPAQTVFISIDDNTDDEPAPTPGMFVDLTDDTPDVRNELLAAVAAAEQADAAPQQDDLVQPQTDVAEDEPQVMEESIESDVEAGDNDMLHFLESDEDINADSDGNGFDSNDSGVDDEDQDTDSDEDIDLDDDSEIDSDEADGYEDDEILSDDEINSHNVAIWDETRCSSDSPKLLPLASGALLDPHSMDDTLLTSTDGLWSEPASMEMHNDTAMDTTINEEEELIEASAKEQKDLLQFSDDITPNWVADASPDAAANDDAKTTLVGASSRKLPGYQSLAGSLSQRTDNDMLDFGLRLPPILNVPSRQVSVSTNAGPVNQPSSTQTEAAAAQAPTAQQTAIKKAAVPVATQLVPQSPLIESGDRFLSYPPEEASEIKDRDSPELDMGSAHSFHQSKMNSSTVKDTVATSKEEAPKTPPRSAEPVAQPDPIKAANANKRKAADISDVTEAEEAQQKAAEVAPVLSQKESLPARGTDAALAALSAKPDVDRQPKRARRMIEAARLVALGGAAAGVALFTTLVATAPSF